MKADTLLLVAILLMLCGCHKSSTQSSTQVWDDSAIFIDNISDQNSEGEEFAEAFAQEPECRGLSLRLWTHHAGWGEGRPEARWWFQYGCRPEYKTYHSPDACGGQVSRHEGSTFVGFVAVIGDSPAKAAQQVCFIVKGKGGTVR